MSPRHIAFIMDGNRRWAKKLGEPLRAGYQEGVEALKKVVPFLIEKGVPTGSFFAFSTENWRRSLQEISLLQDVVEGALETFQAFADEHNVRVTVIGDISGFRQKIQNAVKDVMEKTRLYTAFHAQVAVGYGGVQDIVHAAQAWADRGDKKNLTPEIFESYLSGHTLGPVDMLVRTGGQRRLSNFLLWQCAYADLFFLDEYWPDITHASLEKILHEFAQIKRNYGV